MNTYVRELCASYRRVPSPMSYTGRSLSTPEAVAALAEHLIGSSACERFLVLHLDVKNRLRSFSTVGVGSVAGCPVAPGEILKTALLANSATIIVCHNHPSSDPSPSAEDDALTRRIMEAGRLVDIPVIDHVIVGGDDGRFYSYAAAQRLPM